MFLDYLACVDNTFWTLARHRDVNTCGMQVQLISLQTGKQPIFMSVMQDTFACGGVVLRLCVSAYIMYTKLYQDAT